jgi:dihydrofolate reductase
MSASRVRVYIACSIDGFIAGPGGDLSWLPGPEADAGAADPEALGFEDFMATVGALLMGRATYDAVRGFGVPWPYGERPVLVASSRPLDGDAPATVRRVEGSIQQLIAQARQAAGDEDVYLDGGAVIRQAADARLIDELTVTMAPIALGSGHPLFAGLTQRYPLEIRSCHRHLGGMLQLRMVPTGS